MKEYISHDELMQVLVILDLPADVLSVELRPRDVIMLGVESSWMLVATRQVRGSGARACNDADQEHEPYTIETLYVPVLLPHDEDRLRKLEQERLRTQTENMRRAAESKYDKPVEQVFLPDAYASEPYEKLDLARVPIPEIVSDQALDFMIEASKPLRYSNHWNAYSYGEDDTHAPEKA